MTWAEFRDLVAGLFAEDTRLARALRPAEPQDEAIPDFASMTY